MLSNTLYKKKTFYTVPVKFYNTYKKRGQFKS